MKEERKKKYNEETEQGDSRRMTETIANRMKPKFLKNDVLSITALLWIYTTRNETIFWYKKLFCTYKNDCRIEAKNNHKMNIYFWRYEYSKFLTERLYTENNNTKVS